MDRKYFAHVRVATKITIVNVKGTTSYARQDAIKTSLPATIKHRKITKQCYFAMIRQCCHVSMDQYTIVEIYHTDFIIPVL